MPEREIAKDVFEAMQLYQDDVYRAALMATGNFADAEDILQDVFLKYYQSHPVFASPSHEKAWLLRCAINAGHDLRRSIWVSRRADAELDSFAESAGESIPMYCGRFCICRKPTGQRFICSISRGIL